MIRGQRRARAGILVGVAVVFSGCSSASEVLIGADPLSAGVPGRDAGHEDAQHRLPDATAAHDATRDSPKGEDVPGQDAAADAHVDVKDAHTRPDAHDADAPVDARRDTGVDAGPPCPATRDAGGAPGTFDETFENGDKSDLVSASPTAALIDATGKIYVVGERENCVSAGSLADFAVSRFTPDGALDLTFGVGGSACVDFVGGEDAALGAAFDGAGNIVMVGYSTESPTAVGDASAGALFATSVLGIARVTPAGVVDTTFGTGGTVRVTLQASDGSCSIGAGCAPREVQQGNTLAFDASFAHFYVVGTTEAYPGVGDFYTAGFVAAFNTDGSIDPGFNPSGAHPGAAYGAPGYVTDDGLVSVTGVLVGGESLYTVGTDKGPAVDGGFANAGRRVVTRRYFAATGALDPTWNPSGPVAGEVRTVIGTNDYGSSVLLEPTGDVLVSGVASVGGPVTSAGGYGGGAISAVRFSPAGALDITFGSGGMFVASSLMGFPAYQRFIATRQCDGRILLGGFIGSVNGCEGSPPTGCQALGVTRLTANGAPDPMYGTGDAGTGVISQAFPGTNVITGTVVLDPKQNLLALAGDQGGYIVFEHIWH
jgi:uncharacterized delta-60 repeat protein